MTSDKDPALEAISCYPIAHVHSDFPEKFGIPRQAGLVPQLRSRIVFTKQYRRAEAIKGLADFSHLWLIWVFSAAERMQPNGSLMVRPPRLGGDIRMGVFATRSPFRPNPIGLSSVELLDIDEADPQGPSLLVAGADLMHLTPIIDIKPYVAADLHPGAKFGFTTQNTDYQLEVDFPAELMADIPAEKLPALLGILAQDPRPAYQNDPNRSYGLAFAGHNIRFQVRGKRLSVIEVTRLDS